MASQTESNNFESLIDKPDPIRNIVFRSKSGLDIDILSLTSLFERFSPEFLQKNERVHFYLILLFTKGIGTHFIDFVPHHYDAATLLFLSKGQIQQFQVNNSNDGYLLLFTSKFLYENTTELDLFRSLQIFDYALQSPSLSLSIEDRFQFLNLFRDIEMEYQQPADLVKEEILRHLLRLVLLKAERLQRATPHSRQIAPYYKDFVEFREIVERDYKHSRHVAYYARQLGISSRKLNELTNHVLNKTAKSFIEDRVLLEAKRLLSQQSIPIKEIAYYLGFTEPTNMGKFFKKHTALSPLEFRQQYLLNR